MARRQPPDEHRERIATYFDPLPIWYEPFEGAQTVGARNFPLSAVTQRPPFMYHAWGSQNAWLRQIVDAQFPVPASRYRRRDMGCTDDDWVHVDSHHGRITVPVRLAGNVQPDTVWTWNAIGKRRGAWKLATNAPESTQGFLLNHLISDITPRGDYANADPVTGQAAWFDLRVRIEKADRSRNQRAAVRGAGRQRSGFGALALRRAVPPDLDRHRQGTVEVTTDALLTLLVVFAAAGLFISEKLSMDVVAMLVLASLLILGLVSPTEALSGFSNEATITVAAMFVLSAGLAHTGALHWLGRLFARVRWRWLFLVLLLTVVGAISAFINNTAAVAVFLPMVLAATAANGHSPSQVLIPMSYAAQMGGVCTLIGTSTNLLVNSMAKDLGHPGFGLFDFTPLGLITMAVGFVYMLVMGRWLLPHHPPAPLTETYQLGKYITELRLMAGSPLIGKTVAKGATSRRNTPSMCSNSSATRRSSGRPPARLCARAICCWCAASGTGWSR